MVINVEWDVDCSKSAGSFQKDGFSFELEIHLFSIFQQNWSLF